MFLAIIVGFTLITLIHSISYGALETIRTKAARYFSGHISITGYVRQKQTLDDAEKIIHVINKADLPIRTISSRTIYYRQNASIFFGGESIRQRRLIGIDFEKEKRELSKLEFLNGSIEKILEDGDNGILISESAAEFLGARLGDSIMLYLTTDTNQYNTANLIIKGIFKETSLFGYVAYMNKNDLNRLLGRELTHATDIAIYTYPGTNDNRVIRDIRKVLSKEYRILPYMSSKSDLYKELKDNDKKDEIVLAPLTLDAHLDQIKSVLNAVQFITWSILFLFMLIVTVGILNTYRVLLIERIGEIGTLRAIGMQKTSVRRMFVLEAIIMGLFAILIGFFISAILIKVIAIVSLSDVPGAGLFSEQGHLHPLLEPVPVIATIVLMLMFVIVAAFSPAYKASKLNPAEALRTMR